jgi:hypothetical protein
MAPGDDFLPEVCKIKHDVLDKDLAIIKKDIREISQEERDQHEEIKEIMAKLSRDIIVSHTNLKNKIVLVNRSVGDKIDELKTFDDKLRGNGDPGVWESVRANKEAISVTRKIGYWFIGAFIAVTVVLAIITLGGSWNGIGNKEEGQKTKQVEPASKTTRLLPLLKNKGFYRENNNI